MIIPILMAADIFLHHLLPAPRSKLLILTNIQSRNVKVVIPSTALQNNPTGGYLI